MNQLILDVGGYNLILPESMDGGYDAHEEPLYKDLTMASGRLARETKLRSRVWLVSYQYGWLDAEDSRKFCEVCRNGLLAPLNCSFLVKDREGLVTSKFLVTSYTPPKFMWSSTGDPIYANYAVSLREVMPHA